MSDSQICQFQTRKLVKKNQISKEQFQIDVSSSSGTQQLNQSIDQTMGQQENPQNKNDSMKITFGQKETLLKLNSQTKNKQSNEAHINKNLSTITQPVKQPKKEQEQEKKEQQEQQKKLNPKQQLQEDQSKPKKKIVSENKKAIHILAVSDNHGDYKAMNHILNEKGDIFIHAGIFIFNLRRLYLSGKR